LRGAEKLSGTFVNVDNVGPHRNQYSRRHWRRITRVNRRWPAEVRTPPLRRAHLPTMLATDPTEAIHSELILATVARNVDIFERHDTGGGIADELLTSTPSLHTLGPAAADPYVRELLR
jgi:hypothetical protein